MSPLDIQVSAYLEALGATPPNTDYNGWKLETEVGTLYVKPNSTWIHMKFKEPARAYSRLGPYEFGLNPYSGKWNIHLPTTTFLAELERRVARVHLPLPTYSH